MSATAVPSLIDDLDPGAVKLIAYAQRANQEVLTGFEPTIFR